MTKPTDVELPSDDDATVLADKKDWAVQKLKEMTVEEKIRLLDSLVLKVEREEKKEDFDHKAAFYTLKSVTGLCFDVIDALATELEKERKLLDQMALSTILKKALNPT